MPAALAAGHAGCLPRPGRAEAVLDAPVLRRFGLWGRRVPCRVRAAPWHLLMPAALPGLLPPPREPLELVPDQGRDRGEAGAAVGEPPRHPGGHGPALRLQRHDLLLHPARRHLLPLGHRWEPPPAPLGCREAPAGARAAGRAPAEPHVRLPPAPGASASAAWGWIAARASHAATRAPDLTVPLGAALTSRGSGIYSSPGADEPPLPAPVPLRSRCGVQPPGPVCCSAGAGASGTPGAVPGMAIAAGVSAAGRAPQRRSARGPCRPPTQGPLTGRSCFLRGAEKSPSVTGLSYRWPCPGCGVLRCRAQWDGRPGRCHSRSAGRPSDRAEPAEPCPSLASCLPRAAPGLDPVPVTAAVTVPT